MTFVAFSPAPSHFAICPLGVSYFVVLIFHAFPPAPPLVQWLLSLRSAHLTGYLFMKAKLNRRGFTLVELLTAIVLVGILSAIMIGRFITATDRAHVTAAISDVDHFRKALSIYSVDYGVFPDNNFNEPRALAANLVDPVGNPYMVTPDGQNFGTFSYSSINAGDQYELEVQALDHAGTMIIADADGSVVQ
jgi:prepilin-type N-terminal cleavage/methylation domain-containing protein